MNDNEELMSKRFFAAGWKAGHLYALMHEGKMYTPLRKFYAWVGFITLILLAIAVIVSLVWAHHFIKINL